MFARARVCVCVCVWLSVRVLCAWLAEESDAKREKVCSVLPSLLELCGGRVHRCVVCIHLQLLNTCLPHGFPALSSSNSPVNDAHTHTHTLASIFSHSTPINPHTHERHTYTHTLASIFSHSTPINPHTHKMNTFTHTHLHLCRSSHTQPPSIHTHPN